MRNTEILFLEGNAAIVSRMVVRYVSRVMLDDGDARGMVRSSR
jgi:hypothetical protein